MFLVFQIGEQHYSLNGDGNNPKHSDYQIHQLLAKLLGTTKEYLYNFVQPLNDSKIFAGLVILTLNLSSKMITLPMSAM